MFHISHIIDTNIFKGIQWSSIPRHFYSTQDHYDVLKLNKDCSDKDIRDSFVKLSKQHHPDTNTNVKDGTEFRRIMEAYKVLGKTESRAKYDGTLHRTINMMDHDGQIFRPQGGRTRYYEDSVYGVKGIKRMRNSSIVIICIVFGAIGAAVQFWAISSLYRHSVTFKRKQLLEHSAQLSNEHKEVRAEAEKYGNEVQMERLRVRLGVPES